ncbi:hypothetical protein BDV29DRAFT_183046 [Aspergillus leporis]|uniref:Uncharacterized protein n=1 Tax=Aspergillus leporis TaxID=41062 RepID=A0A5N5WL44_9EURO|nr:hypothetical protein BDV29DRAFT_183046 [Aspergillus leporis]
MTTLLTPLLYERILLLLLCLHGFQILPLGHSIVIHMYSVQSVLPILGVRGIPSPPSGWLLPNH